MIPLRWSLEDVDTGVRWQCLRCEAGTGTADTPHDADADAHRHWRATHSIVLPQVLRAGITLPDPFPATSWDGHAFAAVEAVFEVFCYTDPAAAPTWTATLYGKDAHNTMRSVSANSPRELPAGWPAVPAWFITAGHSFIEDFQR